MQIVRSRLETMLRPYISSRLLQMESCRHWGKSCSCTPVSLSRFFFSSLYPSLLLFVSPVMAYAGAFVEESHLAVPAQRPILSFWKVFAQVWWWHLFSVRVVSLSLFSSWSPQDGLDYLPLTRIRHRWNKVVNEPLTSLCDRRMVPKAVFMSFQ